MLLYEKLDYLLSICGMTNSKLAKKLHVDPSLVGKWRRGQRRPSSQAMIDEIGRALATYFQSDYMCRDLSMMANVPVVELSDEKAIQNAIITWLSTSREPKGAEELLCHGETQGDYHSRLQNEHLAVNHKGRILVLKKLTAQLDAKERWPCLRLFWDEPCEWLEIFSNHLEMLEANDCDAYDRFDRVCLLIPSNVGEREWQHVSNILSQRFDHSDVTVAILERDFNGAFQHSVMIAGDVFAIASFGFYGSQNILSLGYKNSTVVNALIADYDSLFNRSSVILKNYRDYTPQEQASGFSEMLGLDSDIYYCSYAMPPSLIPSQTLRRLLCRVDGVGLNAEKHGDLFCHNLSRFLEANSLYTTFILHSLEDVENGSVEFPHSRGDALKNGIFTLRDYLEVLRHAFALYRENANLFIKLVGPEEMKHDLLVQEANYFSVSKRVPRKYTYISTNRTLVAHAVKWAREFFADVPKEAARRKEICSTLHRTIELFEEHLA